LRASAVMGFRCPCNGKLRKPIFIVLDPSLYLTAPRIVSPKTLTRIEMTVMRGTTRCERALFPLCV
jgi:hypothetical protein